MSGELLLSALVFLGGVAELCATFTEEGRRWNAEVLFWWKKEKTPHEVRLSAVLSVVTGLLLAIGGLGGVIRGAGP